MLSLPLFKKPSEPNKIIAYYSVGWNKKGTLIPVPVFRTSEKTKTIDAFKTQSIWDAHKARKTTVFLVDNVIKEWIEENRGLVTEYSIVGAFVIAKSGAACMEAIFDINMYAYHNGF